MYKVFATWQIILVQEDPVHIILTFLFTIIQMDYKYTTDFKKLSSLLQPVQSHKTGHLHTQLIKLTYQANYFKQDSIKCWFPMRVMHL